MIGFIYSICIRKGSVPRKLFHDFLFIYIFIFDPEPPDQKP